MVGQQTGEILGGGHRTNVVIYNRSLISGCGDYDAERWRFEDLLLFKRYPLFLVGLIKA